MALRHMSLAFAIAAFVTLAGCASSGEEYESVGDAARAACAAQNVPEGPQMDVCVDQMSADIRAARSYQPEPQHPAPQNNGSAHPSAH